MHPAIGASVRSNGSRTRRCSDALQIPRYLEWREYRAEGSYHGWAEDAAWLAIVHVPPHSRQRQNVVTVIVFASVSMILPAQKGYLVGRVTFSLFSR